MRKSSQKKLTPKIIKPLELAEKGFQKSYKYFQGFKVEWIGNLNREMKTITKKKLSGNSRTEKYSI